MDEEQISFEFEPARQIYTVAGLNAAVRSLLESQFQDIWVSGEISGVKLAASGHYYFTMKDEQSQLRCVLFRTAARYLRFKPQDGIAVLARGRVDVYEPRGEYQLLVEALEPQGFGALQLAFEQLKKKLAGEGLFDASRKRPLPRLPRRIGIVTSPSGAVIRDMLQILERRFPGLHIRIYPAQVQGAGSIDEVVAGLDWFSQSGWPDVVIVGRGGGSLEDLWTFNEEAVARAIARSAVPVVSAVGHETDVTIADFVADLRAPTPSAAAELVICTRRQLFDQIDAASGRLEKEMRYRLTQCRPPASRAGHRARHLGGPPGPGPALAAGGRDRLPAAEPGPASPSWRSPAAAGTGRGRSPGPHPAQNGPRARYPGFAGRAAHSPEPARHPRTGLRHCARSARQDREGCRGRACEVSAGCAPGQRTPAGQGDADYSSR